MSTFSLPVERLDHAPYLSGEFHDVGAGTQEIADVLRKPRAVVEPADFTVCGSVVTERVSIDRNEFSPPSMCTASAISSRRPRTS